MITRRAPRCLLAAVTAISLGAAAPANHGSPPGAVEVPFTWDHHSIRVEVQLAGGQRLSMLLDTGWHPVTLDDSVARAIGVAGGSLPILRMGDLVARRVPFDTADLGGIHPPGSARYHGVIGCAFLRDRVVQIDYQARRLRFLSRPAAPSAARPARTSLPFHFSALGCLPIVDSVIVNGVALRGEIDTGAALRFLVTPAATRALGLTDSLESFQAARSGYFEAGASRSGQARVGRLRSVVLGDLRLENVQAVFGGAGEGLMDQRLEVWGVLIGNAFLADYLVTLDFPRRRILLDR